MRVVNAKAFFELRPGTRVHLLHEHGQPLPGANPLDFAQGRLRPLLDRADRRSDHIHMEVPRVEYEKLSDERLGEASTLSSHFRTGTIQARAEAARERQRFEGTRLLARAGALANARVGPAEKADEMKSVASGGTHLAIATGMARNPVPAQKASAVGLIAWGQPTVSG